MRESILRAIRTHGVIKMATLLQVCRDHSASDILQELAKLKQEGIVSGCRMSGYRLVRL